MLNFHWLKYQLDWYTKMCERDDPTAQQLQSTVRGRIEHGHSRFDNASWMQNNFLHCTNADAKSTVLDDDENRSVPTSNNYSIFNHHYRQDKVKWNKPFAVLSEYSGVSCRNGWISSGNSNSSSSSSGIGSVVWNAKT